MRKTFCDRHSDKECVNRIGRLHLSVTQQTSKGETVSEDEYKPMELCGDCVDELINQFFGGALPLQQYTKAMAMEAEVPMMERAMVNDYPTGIRDE